MTSFTLIVALLTVESSYSDDFERPATTVPDTVQFWFAPDSQWRIKTYAVDHDIHVHSIGQPGEGTPLSIDFARANIEKHYGDVLATMLVIDIPTPDNQAEVQAILRQNNLLGELEVSNQGFAFYNPDSGDYTSKSRPE